MVAEQKGARFITPGGGLLPLRVDIIKIFSNDFFSPILGFMVNDDSTRLTEPALV
jgi:hypothetical protein